MKPSKQIVVRISLDLHDRLLADAKKYNRTLSESVRINLEKSVK